MKKLRLEDGEHNHPIYTIRDSLINNVLVLSSIFLIPTLIASAYRMIDIGVQTIMYFHFLSYFFLLLLTIFRKKLSISFKASTVIFTLILLGVIAIMAFGISAEGILALFVAALFTAVFYGLKASLVISAVNIVILSVMAFLVAFNYWEFKVNIKLYTFSASTWAYIGVLMFSFCIIFSFLISRIITSLSNNITALSLQGNKFSGIVAPHIKADDSGILKESKQLFSLIKDMTKDVYMLFTLNSGVLVDVNEAFIRFTGYEKSDILGMTIKELEIFGVEMDYEKLLKKIKNQEDVGSVETELRTQDQRVLKVVMSLSSINVGGNNCIAAVLCHTITPHETDITQ